MLFKIDTSYYVRVGHYFVEVEFIYGNDDIAIKPTNRRLEITKNLQYTELLFLDVRKELLEKHRKSNKSDKKSSK